jgi:hypothetical protein
MTEPGMNLDFENGSSEKRMPRLSYVLAGIILLLAAAAFWVSRENKNRQSRQQVLQIMEKEMDRDKEALEAQKGKVVDITNQLDSLKSAIQLGLPENGKKAVEEYNKLAAQQRAERDTFTQMADEYNKKVAKYRQLE